jgi:ribosomal protein L11
MDDILMNLLTPEQQAMAQQRAQQSALLNLGFGLLGASQGQVGQPRPSLGQIVGQVGPQAMQAYQGSFDQTLKNLLLRQQMEEAQVKRQAQTDLQRRLAAARTTAPVSTGLTPGGQQEQMLSAQLEGMAPEGVAMTREALLSNRNLPQTEVVDQAASNQAILSYLQQVDPAKYLELTMREPKAPPSAIQEYEYAVKQGYRGSYQDFQLEQRKAGATTIQMPSGDKKLVEALGTKSAERLDTSLGQATEAQVTLSTISEIRPIIAEGVFSGPLSGATRTVAQLASSLGITGGSTTELLNRTAVAMQGLAKFELSAAAAMRGQGAITENERMLIQRAAAGRLDQFTSSEIQALLTAMEKTANFRIKSHNKLLSNFKKSKNPEVRDAVSVYELGTMPMMPSAGLPSGVKVERVK